MFRKEDNIIDLVLNVNKVPQVAAAYKGKGKAHALDLGDTIEIRD
jgi:hypothetical protein